MEHSGDIRIAETIRALRQNRGINQEVLAEALSVSTQAVSKWETGASVPDVIMIPRIAAYFGVTTDHIYFGGEIPPAQEKAEAAPISLFPDDGVLRVVQFMGGVMLSAEEAGAGEVIELSLGEAAMLAESSGKQIVIPTEVYGSAIINGTVNGDVKAQIDVNCGTVNGNVSAGRDLRCMTVNGNADAAGNIDKAMRSALRAERDAERAARDYEREFERRFSEAWEQEAERSEREAERIARRAERREGRTGTDGASLPFSDDGVLRIVQFIGTKPLTAAEFQGDPIDLALHEAAEYSGKIVIPTEIHGPAVIHGDINGDVRVQGDLRCGVINGNADAAGNIMAEKISGGLGDFGRDMGRFAKEFGRAFSFGRKNRGPMPDLPFPDDGELRVVQFIGREPAVWTSQNTDPIPLEIELTAEQSRKRAVNVHVYGCAEITGDISGNAAADGDINCSNVGGNVTADGDVNCGTVGGNVTTDGDVSCGDVNGSVTTDSDVTCGNVGGNVVTDGDVSCGDVKGNVTAEGDVTCSEVNGSVSSEGDVSCGNVRGDVDCEGDLSCGDIAGSVRNCEGNIECGHIGGNVRCEGDIIH